MPTTAKKCNLCHAELRVSDEAQVVECPVCGCINSYGYSRFNQNDKYTKGEPCNKNTGAIPNIQNHQQQPFSAAPTQGQAQLHTLLGGTRQPGSLHFVDTNSLFQQPPQASPDYSPPLVKTNSFLQPPPQVSQSSQVSIRMLKTNYTSFQQLSQNSLSLQSSLPPVKTKTTFQLPSQTLSPPIPERIVNNFFQQPQQASSPQGSPRPSYNSISYQQPFQTSSPPDQDEVHDYSWKPQKTQTPQGSPRPLYTKILHQQPFQTSPPGQDKFNEFSWQPQKTPSAQGSPRPYSNTPHQQPLISSPPTAENTKNSFENPQETSSPQGSPRPAYTNSIYQPLRTVSSLIPEKANNFSQLPQRTSSPQWPSRPAYSNTSYEQPSQTSQPLIQEKTENFSQLAPQTSPPQGSPRLANSNTSYQPPLQLSPPPTQEKINSLSELPHQTSSPKGSPNSSYSNTFNQKPIQSSPQESPHQPQTSSPQGSSPRPSRFSSLSKPRAAQTPPQGSSPVAHNDEYNQKLSQPSGQISSPLSRKDDNDHNQISTPPSREVNNGSSQKPLLASPQMSASRVQPLLQAPRLQVNNSGQYYQKSVPDTRPVSSSIASTPPVTGEQHIRYGTNQGTSGKSATANSQSADNQNSRNTEAFRGNLTGAATNYINKSVADADDDPYCTKRRLKEFREQLQI